MVGVDPVSHELRTRTGRIQVEERDGDRMFLVIAAGHVGPTLVRFDLDRAATFGRRHPEGWWYVVDTTGVLVPNPLNVVYLRRIRRLPQLQGFVVVAPRRALRLVARVLAPVSRPDAVVASLPEAVALVREGHR